MKSNFKARRTEKAEKYKTLSEKNEQQSEQRMNAANAISSFIPMGQPILVGHHSEGRHRRDLKRIESNMQKSVEHDEKAKYYANKAANAESEVVIFSDDPEAIAKLKEKIQALERAHKTMVDINSHYRKYGHFEGLNLDSDLQKAIDYNLSFGHGEKKPFASYSLQNSNTNLRANRERLKQLEKAEKEETTEKTINGVRLVENVAENRIQLFFPNKPSEEIRKQLKQNGFHWSPRVEAWQRHRSNLATYKAEKILSTL